MIRLLTAAGVALLVTNCAQAQSYCDQVKQAVAPYGYEAARRHALEHYGKEAVDAGDKCLSARSPRQLQAVEQSIAQQATERPARARR